MYGNLSPTEILISLESMARGAEVTPGWDHPDWCRPNCQLLRYCERASRTRIPVSDNSPVDERHEGQVNVRTVADDGQRPLFSRPSPSGTVSTAWWPGRQTSPSLRHADSSPNFEVDILGADHTRYDYERTALRYNLPHDDLRAAWIRLSGWSMWCLNHCSHLADFRVIPKDRIRAPHRYPGQASCQCSREPSRSTGKSPASRPDVTRMRRDPPGHQTTRAPHRRRPREESGWVGGPVGRQGSFHRPNGS